jgi:hypothetical protein
MSMKQRTPSSFLGFSPAVRYFLICTALLILITPPLTKSLEGAPSIRKFSRPTQGSFRNEMEGKKTGGIVGDPSRLRGFVLGYDAGPKAGSEDKSQNKSSDPLSHPEYQKPDQFYRYEYGSRAAFIAGFRSGFLRGYKSSFGKMEFKPMKMAGEKESATFTSSGRGRTTSLRTRRPFQKIVSLSEDAL